MCKIESERQIIEKIENYRDTYEKGVRISPPEKIEECTACPKYKGCMTDYVCHTTSVDNAIKILKTGKLLSPVLARNMSAAIPRIISNTLCLHGETVKREIALLWKESLDVFRMKKI